MPVIEYRDRILDWHEELHRLEPELSELPEEARRAVEALVEGFLHEDTFVLPVAVALEDVA